jgi:hypothetical protein
VRLTWWAMWGAERRTCVNMHARGGCQMGSAYFAIAVYFTLVTRCKAGVICIWICCGQFSGRSFLLSRLNWGCLGLRLDIIVRSA